MQRRLLTIDEVLAGYDIVSRLYPHVPSLSLWRAWEYAAYQGYPVTEPVLDVGCGDGRFFHCLYPSVRDVSGIDMDSRVVEVARHLGIYRETYVAPVHAVALPSASFATVFANCSLEHMDDLSSVLANLHRLLRVGGGFLLSVVTDKFLQWSSLPLLLARIGEPQRARLLQESYETYHHLISAFSPLQWQETLEQAGFEVLEYTPVVPHMAARLFSFIDQLWHTHDLESGKELGSMLFFQLKNLPSFPQAFRQILAGVLQMEEDSATGIGAVFYARRKA